MRNGDDCFGGNHFEEIDRNGCHARTDPWRPPQTTAQTRQHDPARSRRRARLQRLAHLYLKKGRRLPDLKIVMPRLIAAVELPLRLALPPQLAGQLEMA